MPWTDFNSFFETSLRRQNAPTAVLWRGLGTAGNLPPSPGICLPGVAGGPRMNGEKSGTSGWGALPCRFQAIDIHNYFLHGGNLACAVQRRRFPVGARPTQIAAMLDRSLVGPGSWRSRGGGMIPSAMNRRSRLDRAGEISLPCARACLQLSKMTAATNWTAARKFRASLS